MSNELDRDPSDLRIQTAVMDALPHTAHPMHSDWRARADAMIVELRARGYEVRALPPEQAVERAVRAERDQCAESTQDDSLIESTYGGYIRVYESSAAIGPYIWLLAKCPADMNHPEGPTVEAVAHLALVAAIRLRDQLTRLIDRPH